MFQQSDYHNAGQCCQDTSAFDYYKPYDNQLPYDGSSAVCCGGSLSSFQQVIQFSALPGNSQPACCLGNTATITYDATKNTCCNGSLQPLGMGCCSGVSYELATQGCCGDSVYTLSDQTCCADNSGGIVSGGPGQLCCGSGSSVTSYDPSTQGCCGSTPFNLDEQICCDSAVSPITDPNNPPQCCGSQSYDAKAEICCNDALYPNGEDVACCGYGTYDTNGNACCLGHSGPGNTCCYDQAYFSTSGRFCCGNKTLLQYNPNIDLQCCGPDGDFYYALSNQCCNGVVSPLNTCTSQVPQICCDGQCGDGDSCCGNQPYFSSSGQFCCGDTTLYPFYVSVNFQCCGSQVYVPPGESCQVVDGIPTIV